MIKHPLRLDGSQIIFSLKQLTWKIYVQDAKRVPMGLARFFCLISGSGMKTIESPVTLKNYFILIFCLLAKATSSPSLSSVLSLLVPSSGD